MKNGIYKIMDVSFDDGVSSGMKKGIAGGMAIVLGLGALAKLGGKAYRFFIKKKKEKKTDKEQVVYAIKKSMQEWKEENENCPEQ